MDYSEIKRRFNKTRILERSPLNTVDDSICFSHGGHFFQHLIVSMIYLGTNYHIRNRDCVYTLQVI